LIIGDRQTGKNCHSIDAIINQKVFYEKGEPVICIYVAIGRKVQRLPISLNPGRKRSDAYTVVISATASDPAAMQFYAPFAGAAIGEFSAIRTVCIVHLR